MNKIVVSFGLAALGASSIQVVSAQDFSAPPSKLWNVTGTLRGFYDDNINGAPRGPGKVESFGFEVSPGVGLNWSSGQTTAKLGYVYSLRYFDKERFVNQGHDSQTHTFDGALNHNFNERYSMGIQDSFVIGQEPDQLRSQFFGGQPVGPVPGNNIRNFGSIVFNGALTPTFGFEAGYDNQLFDYDQAALSSVLNRDENQMHLEGQWRVAPETRALLGYQFGMQNYDELTVKDSRSHYVYAGATHRFLPDLNGSLRAGARFIEFYNADESEVSPYLRASLDYTYAPESSLQVGAGYDFTPTTQVEAKGSQTASLFGTLRHRLAPKLFGSATALFQNSIYQGGTTDGDSEQLYTLGLNLEYVLNPHLSTHIGYNFDAVNSEVLSDYTRNRVYIGLTARY